MARDPVLGVAQFVYQGNYSEFEKYDRTDDFMLFQPDSDFARQYVSNFKAVAEENGETIHYLGQGPEGSMYGFMRAGRPPPAPTTGSVVQDKNYYRMKARSV